MINFIEAFETQFQKIVAGQFVVVLVGAQNKIWAMNEIARYSSLCESEVQLHCDEPQESIDFENRLHLLKLKAKVSNSLQFLLQVAPCLNTTVAASEYLRTNLRNCAEDASDTIILIYNHDSNTKISVMKNRAGKCGKLDCI